MLVEQLYVHLFEYFLFFDKNVDITQVEKYN